MGKLAYIEIAKAGYRLVYFNWQSMVRLGLIPFAVILVAALLNGILGQAVSTSAAGGNVGAAAGLSFLTLLLNIVSMAAVVPFLVAWHRFTFDVADKRMPSVTLAVTKTEFVYFGWLLALGVAMAILYAIGGAILGLVLGPLLLAGGGFGSVVFSLILTLIVLPGVLYLAMRFAFVFPEVALGRRIDPMQSWRQTAQNHVELWLLGLAVILPMVVIGIVIGALGFGLAFIPILGVVLAVILHVASMAIYIAFMAAFTSALSLAYKEIVG
jgi:hypothetical protein